MKAATIARGQLRIGLLVAGLALAGPSTGAASPMLVALTGDGMLITFPAEHPGDARTRKPSGVSGQLIGLDRRPANGGLYGLTAAGDVYTIDPVTAAARLVSTHVCLRDEICLLTCAKSLCRFSCLAPAGRWLCFKDQVQRCSSSHDETPSSSSRARKRLRKLKYDSTGSGDDVPDCSAPIKAWRTSL